VLKPPNIFLPFFFFFRKLLTFSTEGKDLLLFFIFNFDSIAHFECLLCILNLVQEKLLFYRRGFGFFLFGKYVKGWDRVGFHFLCVSSLKVAIKCVVM